MNGKKKETGLAAYGAKTPSHQDANTPVRQAATTPSQPDDNTPVRHAATTPNGKGKIVACTVRLSREDWLKVQHLALDEGTSFQALAVAALHGELKRRGLPGLSDGMTA